MKLTLQELVVKCVEDNRKGDYQYHPPLLLPYLIFLITLFVFTTRLSPGTANPSKYPSQVLGVAEQILFTERCEEALKGGKSDHWKLNRRIKSFELFVENLLEEGKMGISFKIWQFARWPERVPTWVGRTVGHLHWHWDTAWGSSWQVCTDIRPEGPHDRFVLRYGLRVLMTGLYKDEDFICSLRYSTMQ